MGHERPLPGRLGRAVADVFGGYDGGLVFWSAALVALERAIADARAGEERFRSYPAGEFRRLLGRVDDALRMAAAAVDVQAIIDEGELDGRERDRDRDVAELLLARARELADERREYAEGR